MDDVFARYREALQLGHQEAAAGRFAQALKHYTSAAELAPDRALPHIAIGGMHLRLGQARESLAAYDRALEAEPSNIDALDGRTAALLALGKRNEAARVQQQITDMSRAPERAAPGDSTPMSSADALHFAGEDALRAGNRDAAIDAWLAESAEHAAAGHFDAALDAALAAVAVAPSAPRIHLQMARLYFQRGWADKGAERAILLDRLLSLDPDPRVYTELQSLARDNAAADARLAAVANRQG